MNIVVFGAGAMGSLFGALLAQKNTVVLVGRTPHISTIQKKGVIITGKTNRIVKTTAIESIKDIFFQVDLILLTVKSYDTETAASQLCQCINDETIVLSLQNGLDNIEKIERFINKKHLLAGITTQGVLFSKPGEIVHTGFGKTILGELNGSSSKRLLRLVSLFNDAGIHTTPSNDIKKEIWMKTIINSSINPLTGFFGCKNGYLLENPLLERVVEYICIESSCIASSEGISVSEGEMIEKTKEVIRNTAENSSSMLQSIQQQKKTEIDSINGKLANIGYHHKINVPLNRILTELINSTY